MGIDKMKLAKLAAISEAIKGSKEQQKEKKESTEKKKFSNEITFPRLIITLSIFFFLLYLIVNR